MRRTLGLFIFLLLQNATAQNEQTSAFDSLVNASLSLSGKVLDAAISMKRWRS